MDEAIGTQLVFLATNKHEDNKTGEKNLFHTMIDMYVILSVA